MLKHVLVLCWVPSWTSFGGYFWSPFWDPKLIQNLLIFGSILDPFFLGFRSSLGGLKSEKMQTVSRENHFFENVAFLVFEALVRKWLPKWSPKGIQKVIKKWPTKVAKKWPPTGVQTLKHGPQHDTKSLRPKWHFPCFKNFFEDVPKMALRLPKIASNSLR